MNRDHSLNALFRSLIRPTAAHDSRAELLARLAVGFVFVASGALKFLFANQGPGRFAHIGLPAPALLAAFVGTTEIAMGLFLAAGLLTRIAAIPLVLDMLVALATTKLPLIAGHGPEVPNALPRSGFWAFAYQARLDLTMLALCTYFVLAGAGYFSLDAWLTRRRSEGRLMASLEDAPSGA